jgi:hypothetical protein
MFTRPCQKAAFWSLTSRPSLRGFSLVVMSLLCAAGVSPAADLSQAVVRKKLNIVTVAPNLGAQAQPAAQGTVVYDKNVVQTGTASQAELQFPDDTRARMTSNAIFTFDVNARALDFQQGAGLISKPTNSGKIDFRSGAVSGAITGSTVFLSTMPTGGTGKGGHKRSNGKGTTTIVGMVEGKVHGESRWTDSAGREHKDPFNLGPGQMMVARPDGPPHMAQFDIPRFVKTSPLVKMGPLPNAAAIDRAIAAYQADERAGFIDKTNIRVSTGPINMALVGQVVAPDIVPEIVGANVNTGFLPGPDGVMRAQLVWNTSADLDLYLTLPTGQVVSFANVSVNFNNGRANARLDQDNIGQTINFPPHTRVENIVVNGIPLAGLYTFMANNFNASNGTDSFVLRVLYNGHLQVINGTLAGGQNSPPIIVQVPGR